MEHLILSCLESRLEEGGSLYGRFLLGPFRIGQGITIATALRRTLLSELQGVAITAVEINGAAHQYSSIVGVRESALDITLNLKQVVLAGGVINELPALGYINVLGPKEVCGSDLRLPNGISCVNRNQHIATVSSNGALTMKFVISSGKGYITHHSLPAQALKPLSFGLKERSVVRSLPFSPFTRRPTDVSSSQSPPFASLEEEKDATGYDSRYSTRLAGRFVLSSGAACDVVSYVRGRRFATSFSSRKEDEMAKSRTPVYIKEDQLTSSIIERDRSVPGSTEPTSRPLHGGTTVRDRASDIVSNSLPFPLKEDYGGHAIGDDASLRRSSAEKGFTDHLLESRTTPASLQLSEGWASNSQQDTSLQRKGRKDMFFAALAQESDHLGEKKKSKGHTQRESALEPAINEEQNAFFHALSDRSFLPIDAVFMPVNSVNFSLQTDDQWQEPKERVIVELWTNGSVSPRQALHEAATCLVYTFSLLRQPQTMPPFKLPLNTNSGHERRVLPNRRESRLSGASVTWEEAAAAREKPLGRATSP